MALMSRIAPRKTGSTLLLAILAALATGALIGAGPALATGGCDDSWTNAAGGLWDTGTNWSTGAPPISTANACITLPGSYIVTAGNETITVGSLTVGGSGSTPTLQIGNARLRLGARQRLRGRRELRHDQRRLRRDVRRRVDDQLGDLRGPEHQLRRRPHVRQRDQHRHVLGRRRRHAHPEPREPRSTIPPARSPMARRPRWPSQPPARPLAPSNSTRGRRQQHRSDHTSQTRLHDQRRQHLRQRADDSARPTVRRGGSLQLRLEPRDRALPAAPASRPTTCSSPTWRQR